MLTGQFGYGSCRHAGPFSAVPGWKITEVLRSPAGAGLPAEAFQLAAARCGEYAAPRPPEFASAEQLRELPSSLRLDRVDDETVCLLKTAYSGPDYTRRDSIFGHGLLVSGELADRTGVVRPAELWDWDWLHPIGPDEIEDARLDAAVAAPERDRLNPASLRPFAFDRPEILRPLLAALASILQCPRMLVLVEPDPAVAACWFAALQYFLPPAVAWSIPFDTYRKPTDLPRNRDQLSLMAVDSDGTQQLSALREAGVPVISTAQPPDECSVDGRPAWHGVSAEPLLADPWTTLAYHAMELDPWTQQVVFEQIDEIAGSLSARGSTSPLWVLPAALMSAGIGGEIAQVCADLLISHWPSRETLSEAVSARLREQATGSLSDPYRTFRHRAAEIIETEALPSDFGDLIIGGYLAHSLTTELAEDEAWWLPPKPALSAAAYQQLLDAMPGLLRWTSELVEPDPRAARAVTIAGLIVDGAPPEAGTSEARISVETAMYDHLLPVMAGNTTTGFLAMSPPRLARSLWDNGVRRFLTALCDRRDGAIPAEFETYTELIERFRTGVPGERLPPALHEWLSDWLDPLLSGPAMAGPPGPLTLEQAAYRVTSPRDDLDLERAKVWAYLARLERTPSTVRPERWPLTAARLTWGDDLAGMVTVAGELLARMPESACTAELLDAMLLATPLGAADELIGAWRGAREGPLYRLHVDYRQPPPVYLEPAPFLQVDRSIAVLLGVLDYIRGLDPNATSAFARSAQRWLAVHALSFDLRTAIETFRNSYGVIATIRLPALLTDSLYEAAWQDICRPDGPHEGRRERLMAMLHVRSILEFKEDPARQWLIFPRIEEGRRTVPALSARLRHELQGSDQTQLDRFVEEVNLRAQRIADSRSCHHEISNHFENAREFLKICAQSAARLLPVGGSARPGLPFGR